MASVVPPSGKGLHIGTALEPWTPIVMSLSCGFNIFPTYGNAGNSDLEKGKVCLSNSGLPQGPEVSLRGQPSVIIHIFDFQTGSLTDLELTK
ncbi:hypothetical protein STEG23_020606 [Scotinomys teguina]